jgi:hypothetical protein
MVATGVAVLAVTVGSSLFAGTAQARAAHCVDYLQYWGYPITPEVDRACRNGEAGYVRLCERMLWDEGVIAGRAAEACRRATW